MKILVIGDPHVTHDDLEDSQKLADFCLAQEKKVDATVILGDLHHNHSVVRVEVLDFWMRWLTQVTKPTYLLLGNHDKGHDASLFVPHALSAYKYLKNVTIVDEPAQIDTGIWALPFMSTNDFNETVRKLYTKGILFCHQTFKGVVLNGFELPDAADLPPKDMFTISGHIHTPMTIENVTYPGSPKSRSLSDANRPVQIAILDSKTKKMKYLPVPCRAIKTVDLTINDEWPTPEPNTKTYINLSGTEAEIKKHMLTAPEGMIVRTRVAKQDRIEVKESLGIEKALVDFVRNHPAPNGTHPDTILTLAQKRGVL